MNFGEAPGYYRRFLDPIDLVCVKTTPLDKDGNFNFGASASYVKAVIERAKVVVVETNSAMPHVPGRENAVHVSEVDYVIDGGEGTLPELPVSAAVNDVERRMAALVAAEIADGSCLQIGIGSLPNAICSLLREANVRDLGIHTEMMVDGLAELIDAGIISNGRKTIDRGKTVFTFAAGSKRLYSCIDGNMTMQACAVDYTNSIEQISRNDQVVSVNSTAQVDLQGQAASESHGHRHVSGTGGQLQFVRAAYASKHGKSFLCLPSLYEKRGCRESRIVPTLTPGNIVTTPRTDVMYVATEWGLVNLKGKSVAERARALISIAHPDFRDELEREAREKNLIPIGWH
jgi:acyl-CoA hydrolase